MTINWEKYGLLAKPGPDGGPYVIEPKSWELIDEFLAELKAHDQAQKADRVVIAVDFKARKVIDHKTNPDKFFNF